MSAFDDLLTSIGLSTTEEPESSANVAPEVPIVEPQESEEVMTAQQGMEEDNVQPAIDSAMTSSEPDEVASLDDDDINDIIDTAGDATSVNGDSRYIEADTSYTGILTTFESNDAEAGPEENTDISDISEEEDAETEQAAPIEAEVAPNQIPVNSPTFLMSDATSRFSGAEWFNKIQLSKVIIAGIGGIGSNVALQIGRMVPLTMVIYDDDIVEAANMSGQLFGYEDMGKTKVEAITTLIHKYTLCHNTYGIHEKFTEDSEPGDIMICGFDNMEARKTFYTSWFNHVMSKHEEDRKECLYIDGRLSIDTLQVLCIRGDDTYSMQRYQDKFLFKDSEADPTICSMKQTTYMACMIGSVITNLFVNFIADSLNPIIPYDLPFFTEYNAQSMIFKTEN